ncbi:MAG TPA: choice-of-anchor tandem repeat GloVer-containing protein [Terriglobales bacterium]|nr:choice-of-anchor tandem repeat GloVer-containing protein [Terriglobales bacterium]
MNSLRIAKALALISGLLFVGARPAHAQTEIVLYHFCSQPNCADGQGPASSLTRDSAGNFYGTTALGGANTYGTVFELSPNKTGGYDETVLYSFCSLQNCADGNDPTSTLIFDSAGNLYGTTCSGGANGQAVASACGAGFNGYGVAFELSPKPPGGCPSGSNTGNSWCETVLYSFKSNPDGASPFAGLTFDSSGNLYGTTYGGGSGTGTVYELSPNGKGAWSESVLYSFCAQAKCADGSHPDGQLQAANGTLFATTESGGASADGTVFGLSPKPPGGCPTGTYTGNGWCEAILHDFAGHPADGTYPSGTPTLDSAGNLYGTTAYGGNGRCNDVYKGCGTVWKMTASGGAYTETVLHSFMSGPGFFGCCYAIQAPDLPLPGLVLDASGNLFGMTTYGGSPSYCQEKGKRADVQGCGAMFELVKRPKGNKYITNLLWIFSLDNGAHPLSSLILNGGNFYGTTYDGGLGSFCPFPDGCGIAFEFTP